VITASNDLKDIFYNSRTVNISAGATIEYNMNTLLDNITISTTATDQNYKDAIDEEPGQLIRINPFKKLFPLDSILKPFRPVLPGVKYYINLDSDHEGSNKFYDYRTLPYPTAPRVYYPGSTTYYKYWVTPQNTGVNVTVNYIISTASINQAYATGPVVDSAGVILEAGKVVYKTTTDHGFNINKRVTISGSGNSSFNLTNQLITGVPDARTFSVTNNLAQASENSLSKTATLVNSGGSATPTKPALANKIVIAFEKYHTLPATCSLLITYSDNTTASVTSVNVPTADGRLIVYYNGTSWSTTAPFSSSQAISYPAPREIKSINVTTPSAGAGRIIGVTEISARWVKDISSDLVSFSIDKESTSSATDILPVGNITANNLTLDLVKYNQSNLRVLTYNRDEDWTVSPIPNDVIYFAKNAEIRPHFKIFHSLGAVTEGSLKYDRVEQGTYYLESHLISEYGDVQVDALDGSKQLMETLIPDLIYKNAPVTSIIMGILDSVGFTNYNMNILLDGGGKNIDTSIPTLAVWWSENNKTIWDCLQELCRDIQMNAYFDENNILQFYTRDKMYQASTTHWEFHYEQSGNKLANIIDFNKQEVASANQVKIIWKTPMNSLYTQTATDLWASEPSFLISGGLRYDIAANTPAELVNFDIDIDNLDPITKLESTFNYSGYFLVDSEVFEYDAIQFKYVPLTSSSNEGIPVFISSEGDWAQYRALSKTGSEYFKPTGRYRIKARGVFGTTAAAHVSTGSTSLSAWYQKTDEWR
jgi:hypothetical protein